MEFCASLWIRLEVMHLFAISHSYCHAPFSPSCMNTQTHLHTHTTSMPNFSLLGWKLWHQRVENVCGLTDIATEWPIEVLVTAKNQQSCKAVAKLLLLSSLPCKLLYLHTLCVQVCWWSEVIRGICRLSLGFIRLSMWNNFIVRLCLRLSLAQTVDQQKHSKMYCCHYSQSVCAVYS